VIANKEDSIKAIRLKEALKAIADTDYKVIKAVEQMAAYEMEEMYPGEISRREAQREKIRVLMGEEAPEEEPEE